MLTATTSSPAKKASMQGRGISSIVVDVRNWAQVSGMQALQVRSGSPFGPGVNGFEWEYWDPSGDVQVGWENAT